MAAIGTSTETVSLEPMASPDTAHPTNSPMKNPNARHTSGSSRNRFNRGVRVVDPNWTTTVDHPGEAARVRHVVADAGAGIAAETTRTVA
jgi:hypothetical protein